MSVVFLSHASEDQPRLRAEIIDPFKRHGVDFWYSKDDITLAEHWQESIRTALLRCDWFLLVLSQHSYSSEWVRAEISLAWPRFGERKRLVIARLDETPPSDCDMRLAALQYVDLFGDREESLQKLIRTFTGPFPTAASGASARMPTAFSKDSGAQVGPRPRQQVAHSALLDLFQRLCSSEATVRDNASDELERAEWKSVLEWAESLAQEATPDEIGVVLRGVAMLESHARTVQLLARLCDRLGGDLRMRAVRLLERKNLSLRRERLDATLASIGSPYRVIRALGNGLFAASFLARRRGTNFEVVVRVLLDKHSADDEVRAKFLQSMDRFSRYVHQRLALTREVASYPDENLYFCVRDYIRGSTLQSMCDEGIELNVLQVLRLLRQVMSALEPAHENGDAHLAVKPSNVYLANGKDVILGDPSLPIIHVSPAVQRVMYEARYAAPECFDPESTITPAADVYSLGCLGYHLLCGRPPFVANTYRDLLDRHRMGVYEPPSKRRRAIGSEGDDLFAAMLAVDPSDRPTNVGDILDSLIARLRPSGQSGGMNGSTLMPIARGRAIEPQYSIIPFMPKLPPQEPSASEPPAIPWPDDEGLSDSPSTGMGGVAIHPGPEPEGGPPGAGHASAETDEDSGVRAQQPIDPDTNPPTRSGALGDVTYRERMPPSIGPWRILSRIGEGGFGEVFLGEQTAPFRRRVAIKIIKPGMDSRAVIARFEHERQALALMEHPNIARIIDGGVTEWGRPYFVMEYIQGESITAHCDRNRLAIRERLALLRTVCEAVQYAHTRGVIHRDIKPSNILVESVNGEAVPKIIDFGVAKSLVPALTAFTFYTELGQLIGTPEYMSPEQAEMGAADIDTRTDIYSLGAVMYELITGMVPFDPRELRAKGYGEIQRLIREVDPARPSARVALAEIDTRVSLAESRRISPADLSGLLRRELEWIPLKAMRKDRTQRYHNAGEMGDDIQRYLDGQPLLAGPESISYRLRKLVARNRVVLLSAALGALVTATAAAVMWLLARG